MGPRGPRDRPANPCPGDGAAAGAVSRKEVLLEGVGSDPAREAGPHRKRKGDRERTVKPGRGWGYGRTARLAAHSPEPTLAQQEAPCPSGFRTPERETTNVLGMKLSGG